MMMRRSNSRKLHRKRKLFAMLLVSCSFATFVLIEYQRSIIQTLNLTSPPSIAKPKIAFLFIARNRIPLDIVWDVFFKGDAEDRFSIYVHARPGFLLNAATTRSTYFLNRQINDSIQVDWGEASMIHAERILLQNALSDQYNERFILLSDSCIPLYNFSYTYDYIMSASTSFVDSFTDTKEDRYNPKMDPVIPIEFWRKGSQWVVLIRKHAEIVVQDDTIYPMFEQYCKKKSLPEFWREHPLPADGSTEHNCIPDEHYVQTLLSFLPLAEEGGPLYYCKGNSPNEEYVSLYYQAGIYCYQMPNFFMSPNGYVKGPGMFMVTDDLTVTPMCTASLVSTLKGLDIPFSDVTELVLHIGLEEALSILKASLTSTSALSIGLSPMLMKQPKQEL